MGSSRRARRGVCFQKADQDHGSLRAFAVGEFRDWHAATGAVVGRAQQLSPGYFTPRFSPRSLRRPSCRPLPPRYRTVLSIPVMAEQKLYRSEVARPAVKRSSPWSGASTAGRVFQRVQAYAARPTAKRAGRSVVWSGADRRRVDPRTGIGPGLRRPDPKIVRPGFAESPGQLEPNWASGLPLTHRRPVEGITIGCYVVDADGYHMATPQLLSMARLNSARSRVRRPTCRFAWIDHTWLGRGGASPGQLALVPGTPRQGRAKSHEAALPRR